MLVLIPISNLPHEESLGFLNHLCRRLSKIKRCVAQAGQRIDNENCIPSPLGWFSKVNFHSCVIDVLPVVEKFHAFDECTGLAVNHGAEWCGLTLVTQ